MLCSWVSQTELIHPSLWKSIFQGGLQGPTSKRGEAPVSPSCPHPPNPTFQQRLELIPLQIPAAGTWCGGTHNREGRGAEHQRCLKPLKGLGRVRGRLMPPMWGWALPQLFPGLPRAAGQVLAAQGCSPGLLLLHAALPGALLDGDDHAAGLRAKRPDTKIPPGPLIRANCPRAGKPHSSAPSRT